MSLITRNKTDKVMIFIDARNVLKSVQLNENKLFRLDFYALAVQLLGQRELVAAYVFDTRAPFGEDDRSKKFHDKLRYMGYRVVAREAYDSNKDEQKEVDVAMACEMVVHALRDHYDVAIVVSGDRDFIPAIQQVQSAGKKVEVAAFASSVGGEMRRAGDNFHELEKMPLLSVFNPPKETEVENVPEEAE